MYEEFRVQCVGILEGGRKKTGDRGRREERGLYIDKGEETKEGFALFTSDFTTLDSYPSSSRTS